MKPCISLFALLVCSALAKAGQLISTYNLVAPPQTAYGLFQPQYLSSNNYRPQEQVFAHPTALATSHEESAVPQDLKKSAPFYGNPYIADALAKESLTFNKEAVVYDRPSEKIDRSQILKLINSLYRVHHE